MLAIPTHPSIKVKNIYPAMQVRVRTSQISLDIRDLILFTRSNLNQVRNFLLSTTL